MRILSACLILIISSFFVVSNIEAKTRNVSKTTPSLGYGIRLLKLGNSYREIDDYKSSLTNLEKGVEIVKKHNSKYWEAAAYEYLGYLYRDMGQEKSAVKYFYMAKSIYDKILYKDNGSRETISLALSGIDTSTFAVAGIDGESGSQTVENSRLRAENAELRTRVYDLQSQVEDLSARLGRLESYPSGENKEGAGMLPPSDQAPAIDEALPWKKTAGEPNALTEGTNTYGSLIFMPSFGAVPLPPANDRMIVIPPLFASLNYRISDRYELGFFSGYYTTDLNNSRYENYLFGLKASHVIVKGDDWDLLASIMLGVNKEKQDNNNNKFTPVNGIALGFRYFLTSYMGVFAEAGYSFSLVTVGLAIKI